MNVPEVGKTDMPLYGGIVVRVAGKEYERLKFLPGASPSFLSLAQAPSEMRGAGNSCLAIEIRLYGSRGKDDTVRVVGLRLIETLL